MAYFIFNVDAAEAAQVSTLLRNRVWPVRRDEPHYDALAPGDRSLIYLAAPERLFVGCVALSTAVHDWTAEERRLVSGMSPAGVSLAEVAEWSPPVPMTAVLARIDQSAGARADFEAEVVQITRDEYEIALAVATDRSVPTE